MVNAVSPSSSIFNNLESKWTIRQRPGHANSCTVDYDISMEFASPLYAAVTSQFFDFLSQNINR